MPNANSTVPIPTSPPSSQPASERGELEPGAHDPERVSLRRDPGHQPVAWAGAEAGADVEPDAERDDHDPAEQVAPSAPPSVSGSGDQSRNASTIKPTVSVLMTVPTPKRCPSGIQSRSTSTPTQDHDGAEAQAGQVRETLVQHVVRAHAEARLDHHRDPDAEREQADDEPGQPATQLRRTREPEDGEVRIRRGARSRRELIDRV